MVKYSKEPSNAAAFAKSRQDNCRVHFKNTRECAKALSGMSLRRSKKFLNNVLRHTEAVPIYRYTGGRGRHPQAKQWKTSQCGFPTKTVYAMLKILRNAEANATKKGLAKEELYIDHIQVNKAPTIRRRTFRAHGRIGPYEAHPSHIEIILCEKKKSTKAPSNKNDEMPETVSK